MADDKTTTAKAEEGLKSERGTVKVEDQIAPLVASPTGPVPVSAIVATKEDAEELRAERKEKIEEERNHPKASDFLDEETIEAMSPAERRSVARSRGYDVRTGRLSAGQFNALQGNDEFLTAPKKGAKAKK